MKFLLVTDGTWGDTLPFIHLAINLKGKGHEVLLFTNEFYKEYAVSKGITFVQTTTIAQRNECLQNPLLWHPEKGMHVIGHYVGILFQEMLPQIEKHIDGNPTIVAHSFSYAAKTLAEKYGLKFVSMLISPIQLRTSYRFPIFHGGKDVNKLPHFLNRLLYPLVDLFVIDRHFNPLINAKRKEMGLGPIRGFAHWTTFGNPSICLWPEWYVPFEKDQTLGVSVGFPKRVEIDTSVNPELVQWINSGEAPIVVTMGSGYMFGQTLLRTITEISETQGHRFILVGMYDTDTENKRMRVYKHVQLSAVLPASKLIIHHGGAGTLAQAAVTGTPQLVIPMSHDQPDNAHFVVKNGLGNVLWNIEPTTAELSDLMAKTIESKEIQEGCKKTKERIAREDDGIEKAAVYLTTNAQ